MVKVLISLDERVLRRIDEEARARALTRSALIADLAARGLPERLGPGAHPDVHRAVRELQELAERYGPSDVGDSTDHVREMRDSR